ncbi:MAG TPA: DUF3239 domain-containing protein [Chthoniobacter sp.]|nr:DUF3239 domain-containing protein [Chthoniobacter sp.]
MDKKVSDKSTQASLPGGCRITRREFARYWGANALGRVLFYLTSFLPITWRGNSLLAGGYFWRRMKERFFFGDTNPTVVLDVSRNLVAAYTNLDCDGQKRFPVIRVLRERLYLIKSGARDGQRFAAMSGYEADENSRALGRWVTFHPIVVNCMSTDREAWEKAKTKIPPSHWTALEIGLKQIPHPAEPGLYDIVLPEEFTRPS